MVDVVMADWSLDLSTFPQCSVNSTRSNFGLTGLNGYASLTRFNVIKGYGERVCFNGGTNSVPPVFSVSTPVEGCRQAMPNRTLECTLLTMEDGSDRNYKLRPIRRKAIL